MKDAIKLILREQKVVENRIKVNIPIPDDVKTISNIFKNNGYKIFIVGGAVRDFLLNKTICCSR